MHGIGSRAERRARVARLLADVGLPPDAAELHPHAFAGSQRQRIGIARALNFESNLLIREKLVSALDVSLQAQNFNLLHDLQDRRGVALLFISHDLSVIAHVSDRVAVMYLGRIVETAPRNALFAAPGPPSYPRAARPDELPSPYAPP